MTHSSSRQTQYDIFVSYEAADAEPVRRLVEVLRHRGLSVWFAVAPTQDAASITESITVGLARAKALVAFYSASYRRSRAAQWVLTAAILAGRREEPAVRRVIVVNPEPGMDHIYPDMLRGEEILEAPPRGDETAETRWADVVQAHIAEMGWPMGALQEMSPPQWQGKTPVGSSRFVGRTRQLWYLHEMLHRREGDGSQDRAVVAVVRGRSGVGKTLLVEEYALRFQTTFPGGVFWLRGYGSDLDRGMGPDEREAERDRQIREFAAGFGLMLANRSPEEIRGALAKALGRRQLPSLWVVDDLPAGLDEQELRRWLAPDGTVTTILTAETTDYDRLGTVLEVGALEPDQAYRLLTVRRHPVSILEEEEAALGIALDLGYHPLAVDMAGATLATADHPPSFTTFRDDLRHPSEETERYAHDLAGVLPEGSETAISSVLLGVVRDRSDTTRDLLRIGTVLASAPIRTALVAEIFRRVDLLDREQAELGAERAVECADRHCLTLPCRGDEDARSFHPLVCRSVRLDGSRPDRTEALRAAAVDALKDQLPSIYDPGAYAALEFEIAHARELVREPKAAPEAELAGRIARHDLVRGAYRSAEKLYRQQLLANRALLGGEDPQTVRATGDLAAALFVIDDLAGAQELYGEVLMVRRRILGEEHLDTLDAMNSLAATVRARGDLSGARELQEKALDLFARVRGPDHPQTTAAMNNLAATLHAQGNFEDAAQLKGQVLRIRRTTLGEEHRDTLTAMNNLATTLRSQGDLEGARRLQEDVLGVRRRVLGEAHPDTIVSMHNLAAALREQGDLTAARALQEEVLRVRKRLLGEEHPNTTNAGWNLFITLYEIGDRPAAQSVLTENLRWLLSTDPSSLGADQRRIRDMVAAVPQLT